jgi:AP-3 complex subunit mu
MCTLYLHQDYFGVCSEPVIKDNVVVVYEVLEEMLDNGFPLATESNILKELIKPPTILRTVVNTITGMWSEGNKKLLPIVGVAVWCVHCLECFGISNVQEL